MHNENYISGPPRIVVVIIIIIIVIIIIEHCRFCMAKLESPPLFVNISTYLHTGREKKLKRWFTTKHPPPPPPREKK